LFDKKESHLDYKKLDIGFNAETSLKELSDKKKIGDKAVLQFRMECTVSHITYTVLVGT